MDKWVSVSEAARIQKVSRQAIYLAIRSKRLKAYLKGEKLRVNVNDLNDYLSKKYSRLHHSFKEGKPIYGNGNYNVSQASKMLGVNMQKVYYAIRIGALKAERVGGMYIIKSRDLTTFKRLFRKKLALL